MSAADGQVIGTTMIVDNGPPVDRYNLVLVAEGYRNNELSQFANDAQLFADKLLSFSPFDKLKCAINVFRIDVASNDSGADDPVACGGTGDTPATYFDASFCNAGIRRLLASNPTIVQSVVNVEVPQWHQILVIVNSQVFGGAGGFIANTSVAAGWENIAIHEIGHSAFGLADEYEFWSGCGIDTDRDNFTGAEPIEPNVTINTDRATLKWGELVLPATPVPTSSNSDCAFCDDQPSPVPMSTVGVFEGAKYYHCGVYRPEFNCMMRNFAPFCIVCQKRIEDTLQPFLEECYAPVFQPNNFLVCFFLLILFSLLVVILFIPAIFSTRIRCLVSGFIFRISRCTKGSSDACIRK